jgi:predicted dehydrogenase
MDPKRILIVGAGTMGGNYARLLASGRVTGAALAGVVDIDGEKAARAAGGAPAFVDIRDALERLCPDAAYVATPDALHRLPVEACAAANVSILVEKPLATTNEDAAAMVRAVRAAGVHAEVNYSNRWNPPFVRAKEAVSAGTVGRLRSFNVRLNNPITSPRDRLGWSGQSTPAWFLMSHCLDLAVWLGGRRATTAYATGGRDVLEGAGIGTWDFIHALVRFEDGSDGVFEAAWILPEGWPAGIEFRFRALGESGVVDVDTTNQALTVVAAKTEFPAVLAWAPGRLASFLAALNGSPDTVVTFEEAAHVTAILVAIHRSLETGAAEAV